jgi:hypothetical protein
VWRRLLRDDTLWDDAGEPATAAPELSLEEREILSAFSAHREAAYWPVEGYRYRQIQQLMADVAASAQVTTAVLRAHGHDLKPHVQRYLEQTGWRDFGCYAEQGCDAFLTYVATELSACITGLSDLIALDQAQLRLLIRLADLPPERWAPRASLELSDSARYQRSPAASAITSERDLSPWLEASERAHLVVPRVFRQHLLVYLPSLGHMPQIAAINEDAALLFEALADARTVTDAGALLGGATGTARARGAIGALNQLGVLCEVPPSA